MTVERNGQPLDDGQEEIFVREEFDTGQLEHHCGEEAAALAISGSGPTGDRVIFDTAGGGRRTNPVEAPFEGEPGDRLSRLDQPGKMEEKRMTERPPTDDHRPPPSDSNGLVSRKRSPWLLAGLGVLVLVAIACVMVWVNWTEDSARTGPREVQSDEMRLAEPATGMGATPHADAPTTASGEPAPPKAGTEPNVNDGPGSAPPPQP